jgi:hypothetical protein
LGSEIEPMIFLERCKAWLGWLRPPKSKEFVVVCTPEGFRIELRRKLLAEVRWDDVLAIRAYKIDLFVVDCICMAFQISESQWVEVREDYLCGDETIYKYAVARFDIPLEQWFSQVSFPAFVPNEMLIWQRDEHCGHWKPPLNRRDYVIWENIQ